MSYLRYLCLFVEEIMSYLRYLCLFVEEIMSYLRYLCLFAYGYVLVFFPLVCLRLSSCVPIVASFSGLSILEAPPISLTFILKCIF